MQEVDTALTKLASEMAERLAALENENSALQQRLVLVSHALNEKQCKTASEGSVPDKAVVEDTVRALYKTGALDSSQLERSREVMLHDVNAPHRVLQALLNEKLSKEASDNDANLAGGRLVTQQQQQRRGDAQADCMQRMINLLNI